MFLKKIGKSTTNTINFLNDRINQYSGHAIVVDGMRKSNTSTTNNYLEFRGKVRIKGTEDISLIYADGLEIEEPTIKYGLSRKYA